MRVLLLGGTGAMGKHLANLMVEKEIKTVVTTRSLRAQEMPKYSTIDSARGTKAALVLRDDFGAGPDKANEFLVAERSGHGQITRREQFQSKSGGRCLEFSCWCRTEAVRPDDGQ